MLARAWTFTLRSSRRKPAACSVESGLFTSSRFMNSLFRNESVVSALISYFVEQTLPILDVHCRPARHDPSLEPFVLLLAAPRVDNDESMPPGYALDLAKRLLTLRKFEVVD